MHEGYTVRDVQFWVLVIGLGVASMFVFSAMYAVQPILPLFTREFDVSVAYSSMTMSAMTIGLIIGLITVGFISDRNGRRPYVAWSVILSAVPFVIIPFIDSFFWIVVLRFFQGVALAGVPALGRAYLNEEIHPQYRSIATALYISFNGIGGMSGRVLTGVLAENYSWQLALFILAGSGIAIYVLLLFGLPKSRNFEPSHVSIEEDMKGFFVHFKNPKLLAIFGLGLVLQASFTGVWTFLPFYLAEPPFNLPLDVISMTYFAYGMGIVGAPVAGVLAAKYGLSRVRAAGIFILSAGVFMTIIPSISFVIVGMCVICAGFFTAHSLTATTVSNVATHHKGSASSLYLVSYYVGVAIGSTLLGPVWEYGGWVWLVMITGILPVAYYVMLTWQTRGKTV